MELETRRNLTRQVAHLADDNYNRSTGRTNPAVSEHLANAKAAIRQGWEAQALAELDAARTLLGY